MKENLKNLSLILATGGIFILVGAELFGHVVIAGTAFEAPPRSFAIYEGEHALGSSEFWSVVPPITLALFVAALALNWKTSRRALLVMALAAFIVIFIVSATFIFPAYQEIVSIGYRDEVLPELQQRAANWSILAYCRMAATFAVGVLMGLALLRPPAALARGDR
jgi:hypothetical protein